MGWLAQVSSSLPQYDIGQGYTYVKSWLGWKVQKGNWPVLPTTMGDGGRGRALLGLLPEVLFVPPCDIAMCLGLLIAWQLTFKKTKTETIHLPQVWILQFHYVTSPACLWSEPIKNNSDSRGEEISSISWYEETETYIGRERIIWSHHLRPTARGREKFAQWSTKRWTICSNPWASPESNPLSSLIGSCTLHPQVPELFLKLPPPPFLFGGLCSGEGSPAIQKVPSLTSLALRSNVRRVYPDHLT